MKPADSPAAAWPAPGAVQTCTQVRSDTGRRSVRRLGSAELFGAEQEIEIEHGVAVYRLRMTALGKLILTK